MSAHPSQACSTCQCADSVIMPTILHVRKLDGVRMSAELPFVFSQYTHVTDRWTDRRHYDHKDHACIQCSTSTVKIHLESLVNPILKFWWWSANILEKVSVFVVAYYRQWRNTWLKSNLYWNWKCLYTRLAVWLDYRVSRVRVRV